MPIDVQRFNEDPHIIYWSINGLWSLNELDKAFEQSIELVKCQGSASYIYDLRGSKLMPPHIGYHMRHLNPAYFYGLCTNLAVVVGADHFLRLFLKFLNESLQTNCNVYYATSKEDAEQFLRQYHTANRA